MKRTTESNKDWIALVGAVLFGVPRLDGAACSERHELFDPAPQGESSDNAAHRYAAAVALCYACPCLAECRDWIDTTPPSRRPSGVVAARAPGVVSIGRPRTEVA